MSSLPTPAPPSPSPTSPSSLPNAIHLLTPRLHLRPFASSPRDIDALFHLESNPANARYQTWPPWTREDAARRMLEARSDRDVEEVAVCLRAKVEVAGLRGREVVGRVGGRRSVSVEVKKEEGEGKSGGGGKGEKRHGRVHIDLWFSLLPSMQGRGLATEAVGSFIAELVRRERENDTTRNKEDENGEEEVKIEFEIECDPRNTGSRKLAERLGFSKISEEERVFECKGEMVGSCVYRKIFVKGDGEEQ